MYCDNTNAVLAVQTGRSRDQYIQHCAREIFLWTTRHDIELHVQHRPGVQMGRADALSRADTENKLKQVVDNDPELQGAIRVRVPTGFFNLTSLL